MRFRQNSGSKKTQVSPKTQVENVPKLRFSGIQITYANIQDKKIAFWVFSNKTQVAFHKTHGIYRKTQGVKQKNSGRKRQNSGFPESRELARFEKPPKK